MDPQQPSSFSHRVERLSTGKTYHFIDEKPTDFSERTITLLCVHGFPDLWYGWRNQIGAWVRKGYRVVVPDMLGYGGSDKPKDAAAYSTRRLCDDLAAILDVIGVQKAIIIGHDWGSFTVGRFSLWYPNRLLALIMISVPFTPPTPTYISLEDVVKRAPNLGYQLHLADPKFTSQIEQKLDTFLPMLYAAPSSGPAFTHAGQLQNLLVTRKSMNEVPIVLNGTELEYYKQQFQLGGMTGPLSYYRTARIRYEEERDASLSQTPPFDLPVLYLYGTKDPTNTGGALKRAKKLIPSLDIVPLEGKGHWVLVEAADEVTSGITTWLDSIFSMNKAKL